MAGIRKRKKEIQVKLVGDGLIPVALYVRVSSAGQDVENSIDRQLKVLKDWAAQNGYIVVATFIDEAKSGRTGNRPNLRKLLAATDDDDRAFDTVLVYKFSRFYRNREQSILHKLKLKQKGVNIISVLESQDDTPSGHLLEGMMEAVDQFHSENTSEEVRNGTRNLVERGFYVAGRAPYGTMKIEVQDGSRTRYKLAPDPETAIYIRRIFDLALEEKTESQVRMAANEEGIPNSSGTPWRDNRIHDVLTNVHYAGAVGWGMKTDDPVVTWGAHEEIVTKTEFERVQELLESRAKEEVNPRNAGSSHPFSGLMRCRKCKSPYTYATAGREGKAYQYVVCKNRKDNGSKACDSPWIPATKFEPSAMETILGDVVTSENMECAIEVLRNESGEEHGRANRKLAAADQSLSDIKGRQGRLYAAYEAGAIELEDFSQRSRELTEMREAAEAEREQILASAGGTAIILDNPAAVISHTKNLNEFLREAEPAKCRAWLGRFIKRIWIERGRGTIEYTIPLPADEKFLRISSREFILGEEVRPSTRVGPLSRG